MIRKILLLYINYVLIGTVLIFAIPRNVSQEYAEKSNYKNYYSDEVGKDMAIILDNPLESGLARLFVIDNDIVAIGSFNLDARSAFLSTGSMVVIHSEEVAEEFGRNIFNYTDESLLVNEDYEYVENVRVEENKWIY
uniref:phospholipase D-like domain-containing protein n=1 Tax=Globicatella sulfidifaciens TaxID=136093 RepID=UPI0023EFF541|nr:phospholipase D-like domain-containing protein [Globicatella sulfidifaciens]